MYSAEREPYPDAELELDRPERPDCPERERESDDDQDDFRLTSVLCVRFGEKLKTGSSSGKVESNGSIELSSSSSSRAAVVDVGESAKCVWVYTSASIVSKFGVFTSVGLPSLRVFERERTGSSGSSVKESGRASACCSAE